MDPVIVGDVRARVVRGRGKRGPHDGRLYWRAELGRRVVWTGWASREEAAVAIAQLVGAGLEGARPKVADMRTIRDLLDYWAGTVVDGRVDLARCTREAIRGSVAEEGQKPKPAGGSIRRIALGIGDVRIDRLSRATLDEWVGRRLKVGNAPLTIRNDLGVLARAWQWGRELGATPDQELYLPALKAQPKREKRTPDLGELREVLDWLNDHAPPWCAPFIYLQAATGARVGEVAGLTWDQVDFLESTVELVGKTGPRSVPVRKDVMKLLWFLPRDSAWVWGVAPTTSEQVQTYVHKATDELGRRPFTTHGLRRLAVDQLARSGVDVGTAAALLGHSPAVMLSAYRQVSAEDLRKGAQKAMLGLPVEPGQVLELDAHRSAHKVGEE